jgi:hypothetical protein
MVPHCDTRGALRDWSERLFASGCLGAWSFPWAAPLALLSAPLSGEELKLSAAALREETLARGGDGTFRAGGTAGADFPATRAGGLSQRSIFGLRFDPALDPGVSLFSGSAAEKILFRFSPLLLGCGILREGEALPPIPPPSLSFRAAALANMSFRPLSGGCAAYSFTWSIGKLRWLPRPRKQKEARQR